MVELEPEPMKDPDSKAPKEPEPKPQEVKAHTLEVIPGYYGLRAEIKMEKASERDQLPEHAFFALDKSGSMSGMPVQDARNACGTFAEKMRKLEIPMTVYAFSHTIEEKNTREHGYEEIINWVRDITAGGGTSFKPVLEAMFAKMVREQIKVAFVVWLTDGQDGGGLGSLLPEMKKFREGVEANLMSVAVHCIGFTEGHDAKLLSTLIEYGTKEGSFQYVPAGGRIPIAVNNVYELILSGAAFAKAITSKGAVKKVNLKEVEEDEVYGEKDLEGGGDRVFEQEEGKTEAGEINMETNMEKPMESDTVEVLVFLEEDEMTDLKIEVSRGSGKPAIYNMSIQGIAAYKTLKERVNVFGQFVSDIVMDLVEKGKSSDLLQLLNTNIPLMEKLQNKLTELDTSLKSLRVIDRKLLHPYIVSARELLDQVFQTVKECAGREVSNIHIANLNAVGHKHMLCRSLERKLARKAGPNAVMLKAIERRIDALVGEMNMEELGKKYGESVEEYGHCLISYRTWLEALGDGDCLCLTFNLERPESGIMDPSLITIHQVNTTILTAESFVDSALFATKVGQIITGATFHKGAPANSLVNGLPEEVITGVLPLYINEDHWKVARLRLKPLMGWSATLDVLGYMPIQVTTLPFMLLANVQENAVLDATQFKGRQVELVRDVCRAIYRDRRETMLARLKGILGNYIGRPETRTIDSIPTNHVLLVQLHIAQLEGDLQEETSMEAMGKLLPYILEEEVRRRTKTPTTVNYNMGTLLQKFMPIDREALVDPVVDTYRDRMMKMKVRQIEATKLQMEAEKGKEGEESKSKDMEEESKSESKDIEPMEDPDPLLEDYKFQDRITSPTPTLLATFRKLNEKLTNKGCIHQLLSLSPWFGISQWKSLEEAGFKSNEQMLSLLIQSILHSKNKDRREAIAQNKYISAVEESASITFIQSTYSECINHERLTAQSDIKRSLMSEAGELNSVFFATTKDPLEAAITLKGTAQGSKQFSLYVAALKKGHVPCVIDKVRMLTHGEYKGMKLITDKIKGGGFVAWRPKRKVVYQIWSAHSAGGTLEEWGDAFPGYLEYFQRQQRRMGGEFVAYSRPKANCADKRHHWENVGKGKGKVNVKGKGKGKGKGK